MKAITVRQMPFEFADELESAFIPGEPELSFQLIAASLFLPYLEPYLIRSMRSAKDKVTDPDILKGFESFYRTCFGSTSRTTPPTPSRSRPP